MLIRVHVTSACEVSVHTSPSWLDRLFGADEQDHLAEAVPALGGGLAWCLDGTGRRITDPRILEEIERAVAAWLAVPRRAASTGPPGNGPPIEAA